MSAPQAATTEKADRIEESARAPENSVEPTNDLTALGLIGVRSPLVGASSPPMDPPRLRALQRSAGNRAVTGMLGRIPAGVQRQPRSTSAFTALTGQKDPLAPPVGDNFVQFMSYTEIKDEIAELGPWVDMQARTDAHVLAAKKRLRELEEQLVKLETPSAPQKGKRGRGAPKAAVKAPRSLTEKLDPVSMSRDEMVTELDLIVEYLRTSAKKGEREKLEPIRNALEFALGGERDQKQAETRKRQLAAILGSFRGDEKAQFEQIVHAIHAIAPDPGNPQIALLYGQGLAFPLTLEEGQNLKKQAASLITKYVLELDQIAKDAYWQYEERRKRNKKHPVVHRLVKFATGVNDLDQFEMFGRQQSIQGGAADIRGFVKEGDLRKAMRLAVTLENVTTDYARRVGEWEGELLSGAGRWVLGLTILKVALSALATGGAAGLTAFKVAQGANILRAGVQVAAPLTVAGGFGGAGASAVTQLASGEGLSVKTTAKALMVGTGEAVAVGAPAGVGAGAKQLFGVGKAASRMRNAGRLVAAETTANVVVNVPAAALTGESAGDALIGSVVGAPISAVGGTAVKDLAKGRKVLETAGGAGVGGATSFVGAVATGKDAKETAKATVFGVGGGALSPHVEASTVKYHETRAAAKGATLPQLPAGATEDAPGTQQPGRADLVPIEPGGTPRPAAAAEPSPPTAGSEATTGGVAPSVTRPPISTGPPPGGAPPAKPPPGPVDPVASGIIPKAGGENLQRLADQYDVVIKVRPMNPESIARLKPRTDPSGAVIEPGAMPKMDIIKAKSITAIDELVGAPPDARGLVGLFEPKHPPAGLDPDVHAEAMKRYETRKREWDQREGDYGRYIEQGIVKLEGGLILVVDPRMAGAAGDASGRFRRVAGDIDVYDVRHADGTPLTNDQRNEVTTLLRSMGIGVEHGAHEWWSQQSPETFKQGVYEGIREEHRTDVPLIAYIPAEPPQQVWADTALTRAPRSDRPGQRITPLRTGARPSATRLEIAPPIRDVDTRFDYSDEAPPPSRPGPGPGTPPPGAPPGGAAGVPSAGTVETGARGAAPRPPAAADQRTLGTDQPAPEHDLYLGRVPHSDVPEGEVGASLGRHRDVVWAQQERGRYKVDKKPSEGVSDSLIVIDTKPGPTFGKRYLFKPLGGETPVPTAEARGVVPGHHAVRAKAADITATELGVHTPDVQLVVINGRKGSLTAWEEGTQSLADWAKANPADFADLKNDPRYIEAMASIHALDYLVNNLDRVQNIGNYLIKLDARGKFESLIPIDSELAFTTTTERAVIPGKTSGLPTTYSSEMAKRIKDLHDNPSKLIDQIEPLVGKLAIPGIRQRLNELYADAVARGFIKLGAASEPAPLQRAPIAPTQGSHQPSAHVISDGVAKRIKALPLTELIQRAPTDAPAKPPPKMARRKKVPAQPMEPPSTLWDAIDDMPWLVNAVNNVVADYTERMLKKGYERVLEGAISRAVIFARDAIFLSDSTGTLYAVESNLDGELDPAKPLPDPKFKLPDEPQVLVSEPSSGRTWRMFAVFTKEPDYEDDELPEVAGLSLQRTDSKPSLPSDLQAGELVITVYMPFALASRQKGVPQPPWKAEQGGAGETKPRQTPTWAKNKHERVQKLLADSSPDEVDVPGKDAPRGTGMGQQGTGPGGGGDSMEGLPGQRQGVAAEPDKATDKPPTKPRKLMKKRRAKPDKTTVWPGERGPMLNVWKGGQPESIPMKAGESDEELKQRIEEAAGKQVSTGETLAEAATRTEIVGQGGQGSGRASLEEILEATQFTANAAEYPSRMEMQGGSTADVSPRGWATTVAGGKHKFDMILDYDARHFGLANQVFARLGWIDYFWQVIDISGMDPNDGGAREKGEFESQESFDKDMRRTARIGSYDTTKVREATAFEGLKEDVKDVARNKLEDAEEEHWAAKASAMGLVAVDAAWNIGKTLISAFISKMTEPENRQEIALAKPGQYLIRCLANPLPDDREPPERQTRRATSIAVFPVRVVNISERALEVTRQETTRLNQSRRLLAALEDKVKKDPKSETAQRELAMAKLENGLLEPAYKYSTVQKIGQELVDYDKQIAVLEKLMVPKSGLQPMDLPGEEKQIGLQLQEEILKRWKRQGGIAAWYEYEYHLHDVKEARKTKAEQKELAEKREGDVESGALRPRVTFVSEENGAVVKMDMILGRAKGHPSNSEPRWKLADVTTKKTSRTYDGSSEKSGDEGDAEAVRDAFQNFCDKAEYGRGTIAIEIPGYEKYVPPGQTMLMKPGDYQRWKGRLDSLVEIATIVVPYARAGKLIGRVIGAYGALSAAEKVYDRAANDRLEADFETLTDVLSILAPLSQGAAKLADKLGKTSKGAFVLQTVSKTTDMANEFMMPATFVHDLDKILKDPSLGGPEKDAAIVMLFGKGLRDGVVQYVPVKRANRAGGESLVSGADQLPVTGGAAAKPGEVAPTTHPTPTSTAPPAALPGLPPKRPAPETGAQGADLQRPSAGKVEPTGRRPDVDEMFDKSELEAANKSGKANRGDASEQPPSDPTRPDIVLPGGQGARPRRTGDDDPNRPAGDEQVRKTNAEIIQQEARADARARARAAEFAPLFFEWKDLHPVQRQRKIEQLLNAHLVREGAPHIRVEAADKRPGNASFRYQDWNIYLSKDALNAKHITPDQFAEIVDNAIHEARHALHHFRGLRAALREGTHNPHAKISQRVVAEARAANRRSDPRKEMSEAAYGEAKEIYEITHRAAEREARLAQRGVTEVFSRENVLAQKDIANERLANATKELNDLEAAGKKGTPEYAAALSDHRLALREAQNAHDRYVGSAQETDAWRYGSAGRVAMKERLTVMMRVNGAKLARSEAAQRVRDARRRADTAGLDKATQDYLAADNRVRAAQSDLAGLTQTAPREVGGRAMTHEVPVDPDLGRRTGGAAAQGDRLRPGEVRLPPGDRGGGDESSRPPSVEPAPPDAATGVPTAVSGPSAVPEKPKPRPLLPGAIVPADLAQSSDPAIKPIRKQDVGTDAARDLGPEPAPASVPFAEFAPEEPGRYERTGEKPTVGVTADKSFVVRDTADNGKQHLFKPLTAEKPSPHGEPRGIREGEQGPREVAGSLAAAELGVPSAKARLVTIDGQPGVLIEWHAKNTLEDLKVQDRAAFDRLVNSEKFKEAMRGIDALDYLINNLDRSHNWANYLYEFKPDGALEITVIDNALTFTSTKERADIVGSTRGLPDSYSPDLAAKVRDLSKRRDEFIEKIRPLVGDEAIPGVLHRLDAMLRDIEAKERK